MQKKCILSLLLALTLVLTGCAAHTTDNAFSNWNAQVQESVDTEAEPWSYTITTKSYPFSHSAEDGRVLVEGGYTLPVMEVFHADGTPYDAATETYAPAMQVAQRFNGFFADRLTAWQQDYSEVCRLARQDYQAGGESWQQEDYRYTDTVDATFRTNQNMACVTMTTYIFTGGAHGLRLRTAYNFDMRTGEEITINDMTQDYVGLRDAVALEILGQIEGGKYVKYYENLGLFDDYEEIIPEWMSRTLFFGEKDMQVVFGMYDIAPYSAGDVAFTIPYTLIEPYLNDYGRLMLELD